MIPDKKIANAMSGKTARACDCCIRRRARWYCPADDAFLCQSCDKSVHSANQLARRHERVRLKTASLKRGDADHHQPEPDLPSWHRGLTKKPRTPRHGKTPSKSDDRALAHVTVPELGAEDSTSSHDGETEEQLLYQVPTFDPFVTTEFQSPSSGYDVRPLEELDGLSDAAKSSMLSNYSKSTPDEYLPSDMDLEEFAADVETLLGKGFDDESYCIEELGLLGCSPSNNIDDINFNQHNNIISTVVKEEDELLCHEGNIITSCEIQAESNNVVMKEPFDLTFDYDDHEFPTTCQDLEEDDHKKAMMIEPSMVNELWKVEGECHNDDKQVTTMNKRRKILLKLDYDAISAAWASQGSPWVNGQRPDIHLQDCWPHCMGTCCAHGSQKLYGEHQMVQIGGGIGDGGREARVSRYREKRRTRLFSKKIRYEVRKLNAEKRPRMKGRFVKRSSFVATIAAN